MNKQPPGHPKVAAVTGAYKGLGAEITKKLLAEGWSVAIGGRNPDSLRSFAKGLEKQFGGPGRVRAFAFDVRNRNECSGFVKAAVDEFKRLDLLVNNAGVLYSDSEVEANPANGREMEETNVKGPLYCAVPAMTVMERQGGGHILTIASVAAVDPKPGLLAYSETKARVLGLMGALREKAKAKGVVVSVFSPGGMKTQLFRHLEKEIGPSWAPKYAEYMDPAFAAQKVMDHVHRLEADPRAEWHEILRRPNAAK
jgi:NADP-dependent 3-hydroxy acid dehydrogenase YdfG